MKKKIASVLSVMFIAMMSAASSASPTAPGAQVGNEMGAAGSAPISAAAPGDEAETMKMAPACGWDCIQAGGSCCGSLNKLCCGAGEP